MSNAPNLLFYSNQCRDCQSLLRILQHDNMIHLFKCLCVDDIRVRNSLPRSITTVPTIIIPSIHKQFVAGEIFRWLQSIKSSNIQQEARPMKASNVDNKQQQKGNNPIGFVSQEMAGLSDSYAYTSVDIVPQHTYLTCADMDKYKIYTAPENSNRLTGNIQKDAMK